MNERKPGTQKEYLVTDKDHLREDMTATRLELDEDHLVVLWPDLMTGWM